MVVSRSEKEHVVEEMPQLTVASSRGEPGSNIPFKATHPVTYLPPTRVHLLMIPPHPNSSTAGDKPLANELFVGPNCSTLHQLDRNQLSGWHILHVSPLTDMQAAN